MDRIPVVRTELLRVPVSGKWRVVRFLEQELGWFNHAMLDSEEMAEVFPGPPASLMGLATAGVDVGQPQQLAPQPPMGMLDPAGQPRPARPKTAGTGSGAKGAGPALVVLPTPAGSVADEDVGWQHAITACHCT